MYDVARHAELNANRISWGLAPLVEKFPEVARRRAGRQLELLQQGQDPVDWKPMPTIGPGVREIRVRDEHGIFRVFYVTKFSKTVYVLHCFHKKTQKTNGGDLELASRRYQELIKEMRDGRTF